MADKTKPYKRTFPVSWEQLHRDSRALAWRLLEFDYFKGIGLFGALAVTIFSVAGALVLGGAALLAYRPWER